MKISQWEEPFFLEIDFSLVRIKNCAIITLVILANYDQVTSFSLSIISQLRLSVSHKLVVKGQAR